MVLNFPDYKTQSAIISAISWKVKSAPKLLMLMLVRLVELDMVSDTEADSSLNFLCLTSILLMGTPMVMLEFITFSLEISVRSRLTSFFLFSVFCKTRLLLRQTETLEARV